MSSWEGSSSLDCGGVFRGRKCELGGSGHERRRVPAIGKQPRPPLLIPASCRLGDERGEGEAPQSLVGSAGQRMLELRQVNGIGPGRGRLNRLR